MAYLELIWSVTVLMFNPIWTGWGGEGQNFSLRVFAKYLKNCLTNLYETL